MQHRPSKHDCREHVVIPVGPNGGKLRPFYCGVCKKPVRMRFAPGEVLMRVPA